MQQQKNGMLMIITRNPFFVSETDLGTMALDMMGKFSSLYSKYEIKSTLANIISRKLNFHKSFFMTFIHLLKLDFFLSFSYLNVPYMTNNFDGLIRFAS